MKSFKEFKEEPISEAMTQVAGKDKPAGAQILAMVIVQLLEDKKAIANNINLKSLTDEIKNLIMDSTF